MKAALLSVEAVRLTHISQARHGQRTQSPPPLVQALLITRHSPPTAAHRPPTDSRDPDPIPHRPHNHHRPAEDRPLLRAETETQRNCRLLRRPIAYPPPLATHRLLRRALRHIHPLWRLPWHHCRVCAEYPHHRPVHRHGRGQVRVGTAECGAAGMSAADLLVCGAGRDHLAPWAETEIYTGVACFGRE